jgi:hypothetical protein
MTAAKFVRLASIAEDAVYRFMLREYCFKQNEAFETDEIEKIKPIIIDSFFIANSLV